MKVEIAPPGTEPRQGQLPSHSPINDVIALILRVGVYLSGTILIVGLVFFLLRSGGSSQSVVTQVLRGSSIRPVVPASFSAVGQGLRSGNPVDIIELGVLVLLATPVIRVAASIFLFLFEADWLYTMLTTLVLVLLLVSIFLLGALGIG